MKYAVSNWMIKCEKFVTLNLFVDIFIWKIFEFEFVEIKDGSYYLKYDIDIRSN